jgi:hypothetical protein
MNFDDFDEIRLKLDQLWIDFLKSGQIPALFECDPETFDAFVKGMDATFPPKEPRQGKIIYLDLCFPNGAPVRLIPNDRGYRYIEAK